MYWTCSQCEGRLLTIPMLRNLVHKGHVDELWIRAKSAEYEHHRKCPSCDHDMHEVPIPGMKDTVWLDVCTICHFVWFDTKEFDSLYQLPQKKGEYDGLPQEAREKLAVMRSKLIAEQPGDYSAGPAHEWDEVIKGFSGLPIEYSSPELKSKPWATWGLTILVMLVSVLAFFDHENMVKEFGMVPAHFWRYGGLTFITSFLLHGGIVHLLGNMYFLMVFGDNVEDTLGVGRYLLLVFLATITGDFLHIVSDFSSERSLIGASGGISGVIAYYALRFPRAKLGLGVSLYYFLRIVRLPAIALLVIWILYQIFGAWAQLAGMTNVSSLAHIGGALVGFLFWLKTRRE